MAGAVERRRGNWWVGDELQVTQQDSLGVASVQWEMGGVGEWEGLGLRNIKVLKLDFRRKIFEGSGGPGMKEVEP